MADLLDVDAKDFSLMHESIQMSKLNTLVGTRISLTIKRKVNETATPTTTSLP